MSVSRLLNTSCFATSETVNCPPKRHATVTVEGHLSVPVYIEALDGFWRVAKIIREAGTYTVDRATKLRASLAGDNPTPVRVSAEFSW